MGISTAKIWVWFVPSLNNKIKRKSEKVSVGIKDQDLPAEMTSRKLYVMARFFKYLLEQVSKGARSSDSKGIPPSNYLDSSLS